MSAEALLEDPAVRARITRFTVEQYHQLGEYSTTGRRTELIRGYVFDKMSRSPLHSTIATRLQYLLLPQLGPGWWMRKEEPLTLADSEPEPDISVMRGQESDFENGHPRTAALVVEVAITTLAEDHELVSLYAEAGIEEYWIVIPRRRTVEVYRRPVSGSYQESFAVSGEEVLSCGAIAGVQVALVELFR